MRLWAAFKRWRREERVRRHPSFEPTEEDIARWERELQRLGGPIVYTPGQQKTIDEAVKRWRRGR